MPIMLLPFLPMTTVILGMIVITSVKFPKVNCVDLVKDTLDCDVHWCYDEGGFGCCCCMVCHDHDHDQDDHAIIDNDDPNTYYDDSSESFHAYVMPKNRETICPRT
jgi:hypothetical protein